MKFRNLAIGDTFDFIPPTGQASFYHTCTKVSTRKYKWPLGEWVKTPTGKHITFGFSTVGTINVEVYHVNENDSTHAQ